MEMIEKIKKVVIIAIVGLMIVFNTIVISNENIKLDKIKHQLEEIKIGKES